MKRILIASLILFGAAVGAHANNYVWDDIRKPPRSNAAMDGAVQRDAATCDQQVGEPSGYPSAKYRACMASRGWKFSKYTRTTPRRDSDTTVWDRDSPDPNVGWHWRNGMRVCTQDCDNPEIPGSGAVCRNVIVMGM